MTTPRRKCRKPKLVYMSKEEQAFWEECDRKQAEFEKAGGPRELDIGDKSVYLRKYSPVGLDECGESPDSYARRGWDWVGKDYSNLDARRECLDCGSVFLVRDYKVIAGADMDWIVCPHYPHCGGTPLDWGSTDKPVQISDYIIAKKNQVQTGVTPAVVQ